MLLPVALLLNINVLINPSAVNILHHSRIDGMLESFRLDMPILHWITLSLIFFAAAILINRMVIINRLSNSITLYPGLFFIVLISAFPVFGAVSSLTISTVLLLLLLSNLMYINARSGVVDKIFNVGLYLGLMGLLFMPQLIFFFMIVASVNMLTTVKRRTVFNLINGTLIPFFLIGLAVLLYADQITDFKAMYANQFGFVNFSVPQSVEQWVTLVVIILYVLLVLLTYNSVISKKSIQSIRKINVLSFTILFVIMIHLISGIQSLHTLVLLMPVFAFYTAEGVLKFKKETNAELILILLVILGIVMPFVG